jgi:site-specific recombinase XerD
VQELLGHKDITTTEVYTKLTQKDLLAAHAAFHPRSKAEVAPDGAE